MRIERTDIRGLGDIYLEDVVGKDIDLVEENTPYMNSRKPLAGEDPDMEMETGVEPDMSSRLSMEDEKDLQENLSNLVTRLVAKGLIDPNEAEDLAEETYNKFKDAMGY